MKNRFHMRRQAIDFIDEFNEVKIRKTKGTNCRCKICDRVLECDIDDIVYLKSFRLQAQPFHICIPCWKKINEMVEEYEEKQGV